MEVVKPACFICREVNKGWDKYISVGLSERGIVGIRMKQKQ